MLSRINSILLCVFCIILIRPLLAMAAAMDAQVLDSGLEEGQLSRRVVPDDFAEFEEEEEEDEPRGLLERRGGKGKGASTNGRPNDGHIDRRTIPELDEFDDDGGNDEPKRLLERRGKNGGRGRGGGHHHSHTPAPPPPARGHCTNDQYGCTN